MPMQMINGQWVDTNAGAVRDPKTGIVHPVGPGPGPGGGVTAPGPEQPRLLPQAPTAKGSGPNQYTTGMGGPQQSGISPTNAITPGQINTNTGIATSTMGTAPPPPPPSAIAHPVGVGYWEGGIWHPNGGTSTPDYTYGTRNFSDPALPQGETQAQAYERYNQWLAGIQQQYDPSSPEYAAHMMSYEDWLKSNGGAPSGPNVPYNPTSGNVQAPNIDWNSFYNQSMGLFPGISTGAQQLGLQNRADTVGGRTAPQMGAAQLGPASLAGYAGIPNTQYSQGVNGVPVSNLADSQFQGQQGGLAQYLNSIVTGQFSPAAQALQRQASQASAQQRSMALSSGNPLANISAMQNIAGIQGDIASQTASAQMQDKMAASGALSNLLGTARQQDISVAGQNAGAANSTAQLLAQLGLANNQFNAGQGNQMGMFGANLGQQVNLANQGALNQYGLQQGLFGQQANAANQQAGLTQTGLNDQAYNQAMGQQLGYTQTQLGAQNQQALLSASMNQNQSNAAMQQYLAQLASQTQLQTAQINQPSWLASALAAAGTVAPYIAAAAAKPKSNGGFTGSLGGANSYDGTYYS